MKSFTSPYHISNNAFAASTTYMTNNISPEFSSTISSTILAKASVAAPSPAAIAAAKAATAAATDTVSIIAKANTVINTYYTHIGSYNDTTSSRAIPIQYSGPTVITSIEIAMVVANSLNATVFGIQSGGQLFYNTSTNVSSALNLAKKYGETSCINPLGCTNINQVYVITSFVTQQQAIATKAAQQKSAEIKLAEKQSTYKYLGAYNDNKTLRTIPTQYKIKNISSVEEAMSIAKNLGATIFGIQGGGQMFYNTSTNVTTAIFSAMKYNTANCNNPLGCTLVNQVYVISSAINYINPQNYYTEFYNTIPKIKNDITSINTLLGEQQIIINHIKGIQKDANNELTSINQAVTIFNNTYNNITKFNDNNYSQQYLIVISGITNALISQQNSMKKIYPPDGMMPMFSNLSTLLNSINQKYTPNATNINNIILSCQDSITTVYNMMSNLYHLKQINTTNTNITNTYNKMISEKNNIAQLHTNLNNLANNNKSYNSQHNTLFKNVNNTINECNSSKTLYNQLYLNIQKLIGSLLNKINQQISQLITKLSNSISSNNKISSILNSSNSLLSSISKYISEIKPLSSSQITSITNNIKSATNNYNLLLSELKDQATYFSTTGGQWGLLASTCNNANSGNNDIANLNFSVQGMVGEIQKYKNNANSNLTTIKNIIAPIITLYTNIQNAFHKIKKNYIYAKSLVPIITSYITISTLQSIKNEIDKIPTAALSQSNKTLITTMITNIANLNTDIPKINANMQNINANVKKINNVITNAQNLINSNSSKINSANTYLNSTNALSAKIASTQTQINNNAAKLKNLNVQCNQMIQDYINTQNATHWRNLGGPMGSAVGV